MALKKVQFDKTKQFALKRRQLRHQEPFESMLVANKNCNSLLNNYKLRFKIFIYIFKEWKALKYWLFSNSQIILKEQAILFREKV
jgi:hypothetical protein